MDPKARRFLWNLILDIIKTGRSVVLTSHRCGNYINLNFCFTFSFNNTNVLMYLFAVWRSVKPCVRDWASWLTAGSSAWEALSISKTGLKSLSYYNV